MQVWRSLENLLRDHGRAAMVTVIEVKGSAPREAGARLFVIEDGRYRGTIGGGALEWRAIAEAQRALSWQGARATVSSALLGPELGQCCGGQVKLLTEVFTSSDLVWIADFAERETKAPFSTLINLAGAEPARRIVHCTGHPGTLQIEANMLRETYGEDRRSMLLFGAGHVGRALVLALAPLPFAVTWIDSRPDAFPSAHPVNVTPRFSGDPAGLLDAAAEGSFVVVMTHSHALDFDIVLSALKLGGFGYVGLIGSETKKARFLKRLRELGIGEAGLKTLVCPIGISGIGSKQPAVIAASTAAQLLVRDEQLRAGVHPLTAALRIA
jgi:xanthine dehydrogenase accessory factor